MNHVFKLDEEQFTTVQRIDKSITSWSLELGRLELQLETIKAQLFGNYEARQSLLKTAAKNAGFDLKKVDDIRIGQGGQVMVVMVDPQKESPSEKPPGTTVDGLQTASPGDTSEATSPASNGQS